MAFCAVILPLAQPVSNTSSPIQGNAESVPAIWRQGHEVRIFHTVSVQDLELVVVLLSWLVDFLG